MKVVAPMPVQDAPVSKTTMGYTLSITWRKWLQTIADFAIAATCAHRGHRRPLPPLGPRSPSRTPEQAASPWRFP